MKTKKLYRLWMAVGLLLAFALWTALVCTVDVRPIGPNASSVGLAALNGAFHRFTGVWMPLYVVTDWLGLMPVAFGLGFALLGLVQWIRRRTLFKVDADLLILGGFYLAVLAAYLLFEAVPVNCRPVLIDGYLETSYPSSTTLLVMCVMPTAAMQLHARIKHPTVRRWIVGAVAAFTALTVIGRTVCGVHWFSDIVGGALLSGGLVMLYRFFAGSTEK